jgi:hypothetical protein
MTNSYAIHFRKEARALLPWWLGVAATTTIVAMLARRNSGFPDFRHDQEIWVVMIHALGILAVAAVSVGHELTNNTLSALLVQPVSRLRVLATKLGVLVPAVVSLGILGNWLFLNRYLPASTGSLLVWGPVMAGIGLVPLLTVLTRKPLGGIVFSIVVPGLILAVADRFYPMRNGTAALSITWYGTLMVSVLGVLALWHRFTRLETAGDGGALTTRGWATVRASAAEQQPPRPRNWMWLFVRKELRLQQLTLAVSFLYALGCAFVVVAQRRDPSFVGAGPTFETLTGLHGVFIALLAGSLSSAEERGMGTLTSHVLLPQAAWRQWSVKVMTTAGLTSALAFGLPALLMLTLSPADPFIFRGEFVAGILVVVSIAMYVSSLCANGLWALLATFPALAVVGGIGGMLLQTLRPLVASWFPTWSWRKADAIWRAARESGDYASWYVVRDRMDWVWWFERNVPMVIATGLALLALYFAARNQRSLDRNPRIILRQVSAMALYATAAAVTYYSLVRLGWWAVVP